MYNEWKHLLKTKIDIICLLISLMTQEKKWFYYTYKTQIHIPSSPHIKLKINFIFYIIWSWKNEFNYSFSMNKQIDWHRFHIQYENEGKEKEIAK
jgi:hypothetical protein